MPTDVLALYSAVPVVACVSHATYPHVPAPPAVHRDAPVVREACRDVRRLVATRGLHRRAHFLVVFVA